MGSVNYLKSCSCRENWCSTCLFKVIKGPTSRKDGESTIWSRQYWCEEIFDTVEGRIMAEVGVFPECCKTQVRKIVGNNLMCLGNYMLCWNGLGNPALPAHPFFRRDWDWKLKSWIISCLWKLWLTPTQSPWVWASSKWLPVFGSLWLVKCMNPDWWNLKEWFTGANSLKKQFFFINIHWKSELKNDTFEISGYDKLIEV